MYTFHRILLALGFGAVLAGCAALAHEATGKQASAPAVYPDDAMPAAGLAVASLGWQDYYAEPRLRTLIEQALVHNTDIRTALLRVDEARAAYGITRAQQYPAIDLTAAAASNRLPSDLSPTGQALVSRDYQVALQMNAWELDLWGRVRSLKASALASWLATDAARRAVSLALIAQVADGYLRLREFDERLSLARLAIDRKSVV